LQFSTYPKDPIVKSVGLLTALIACFVALQVACTTDEQSGRLSAKKPGDSAPSEAAALNPSLGTASISGSVLFDGIPPEPKQIDMRSDPVCRSLNGDPLYLEDVLVRDGKLQNVFVYIKSGLEDYSFSPPPEPVILTQQNCRYKPHVAGIMVDQQLRIVNADPTLHNIHCLAEKNPKFNIGQAVQGMEAVRSFSIPEVMIKFRCHVHTWMSCYLGVVRHPFYAVTTEDGRFSLNQLPGGHYVVEAWHERYGRQVQSLTLTDGEAKNLTFTFKAP
jgi:hypothetical protein